LDNKPVKKQNIHIETRNWEEIDTDWLAEFTFKVKQSYETTYDSRGTIEQEKRHLEFRKRFQPATVLLAYKNDTLLGWLSYDTESPFCMEIGRWLPVVKKDKVSDQVFTLLIERCQEECVTNSLTRIEIRFDISTVRNERNFPKYKKVYNKHNFILIDNEYFLRKVLLKDSPKQIQLNSSLIFKPIAEIKARALYECYYDSFLDSKVRMFLDQSDEERQQFFEETLAEKKSLINEASLALINPVNTEVVGLIVVQARNDEAHVAILAISPYHRSKKYGTSLVKEAITQCEHMGIKTMSLGVDADNIPAKNLYYKIGFERISSLVTLAWKNPT
jgi:ribosomal protein S18 acetylase RimI-like enzyme